MSASLPFDDSRRLTGPNLFFASTGAVLETIGVDVDDALVARWRGRVDRACTYLGWRTADVAAGSATNDAIVPPCCVARRHRGGASLAIAAPFDQLYTATEINEWALCGSLVVSDPERWVGLEAAWRTAALDQLDTPAGLLPPVLDETAALDRFGRLAAAERRPDLDAIMTTARSRGVSVVLDEQSLTLGTGEGGRTWPLETVPAVDVVPWASLRRVPTAVVTGSNGKTTTVRVLAACTRQQGWSEGYCCTDGVFVAGGLVDGGDYSGPAGTRLVLRDQRVQAAVLEVARGGILRRGFALDDADVAVVTNVSADHYGEYGIDDLDGLADVKLTVARLVGSRGLLVLNADDDLLRAKWAERALRGGSAPACGWFALDADRPELVAHRASGGATCGVRHGQLVLAWHGVEHDLGPVATMPLTAGGVATYNVSNLAGAALAAAALGVSPAVVTRVFAQFGESPDDNAGRLMRFELRGVRCIVDYAHNVDGLRGVLEVARRFEAPGGRLIVLLGHAGNRLDADIAALAEVAAAYGPELVVIKENDEQLRGRAAGEVPAILRSALLTAGLPSSAIELQPSEVAAARVALERARPGDVVVLTMHGRAAREQVVKWLRATVASS